jgi:hypothetical protein
MYLSITYDNNSNSTMKSTLNLMTGDRKLFFDATTPREAVIASYALDNGDANTWDWDNKYSLLIRQTERCIFCGDWGIVKDA